jgi:hypothetical protein
MAMLALALLYIAKESIESRHQKIFAFFAGLEKSGSLGRGQCLGLSKRADTFYQ